MYQEHNNIFVFRFMLINTLRTCPYLFSNHGFRSLTKHSTTIIRTSTQQTLRDRLAIKYRSSRFTRNYFLINGVLIGGSSLYYFFYLNDKERRQIKVTFEGIQRAFRFVRENSS
jgi:hypothetical protein